MCSAASTLNLHFLLEEQLLSVFLSWSRFMVVLNRITTNFKRPMFVFKMPGGIHCHVTCCLHQCFSCA